MENFIKSLILMSASGGLTAMLIFFAKPATKRIFDPKWQYYIWLIPLFIMLVPIKSVPMNLKTEKLPEIITSAQETAEAYISAVTASNADMPKLPKLLGCVWLTVFLGIFVFKIFSYCKYTGILRKNFSAEQSMGGLTVRKTQLLSAPVLIGLIKPVLYIPDGDLSDKETEYIFKHELTHFKRKDLWYKHFSLVVCTVHWFNPIVYLILREIDECCEISCDCETVKNYTYTQKSEYMRLILRLLQNSLTNTNSFSLTMTGARRTIERRFRMIRKYNKKSKIITVISVFCAVILCGAAAYASGTLSNGLLMRKLGTDENATVNLETVLSKIGFTNNGFLLPNGDITAPFGKLPNGKIHTGIDYSGKKGDPVYAGADGTVSETKYSSSLGYYIIISHENEYTSLYAHLSEINVSEGDTVLRGQIIGKVGASGMATGPHLHFEIRKNGEAVNPVSP